MTTIADQVFDQLKAGRSPTYVRRSFRSIAVEVADCTKEAKIKVGQVEAITKEIMNLIPSMNTYELRQLVENLMNKKPFFDLRAVG